MNLRFIHFCIDFTLLTALLAQCLALPSPPSPPANDKCDGFNVIISNNRTTDTQKAAGDSELHVYVSGQKEEKHGMLIWGNASRWHTLEAPNSTNVAVHENITAPDGMELSGVVGNETLEFCMPKNITSGRLYIVEGELEFKSFLSGEAGQPGVKTLVDEPSAVAEGTDAYNKRWSFLEFTHEEKLDHIIVNPSFVDWVSLTLGFTLETTSNKTYSVPGLQPGSLEDICQGLKNQTRTDGLSEWENLCVYRKDSKDLLRVLSPNQYATINSSAWQGYYDKYWKDFGTQTRNKNFTINTQDKNGKKDDDGNKITCTMPNKTLLCKSTTPDPVGFEIGPPGSITEIWGCNGGMFDTTKYPGEAHTQYLEILPRLCAAMVRSTLLLPGGNIQPNPEIVPDNYYPVQQKWPMNHYSRIVHRFLKENKGYAFAYDDVGIDGHESAGLIDTHNPKTWKITLSD